MPEASGMIRAWLQRLTKEHSRKLYCKGYDYAAGALLRKEQSVFDLTEQHNPFHHGDYTEFEKGIEDAILAYTMLRLGAL